jgi:AraC-like DNA-binding protein
MSRSSFASRFKQVAGTTPMEYLAFWRMHVAADRLRSTSQSVGQIANSVGYESEAAFSRAYKKVFGKSPRLSIIGPDNPVSQSVGHDPRTSDKQSLMSKRSSSEVSVVCLKPGNAQTNKRAALSAVQEFSSGFLGAMEVRNLSTRFSNLRDPYPGRPVAAGCERSKPSCPISSFSTNASITRQTWFDETRSSKAMGNSVHWLRPYSVYKP